MTIIDLVVIVVLVETTEATNAETTEVVTNKTLLRKKKWITHLRRSSFVVT
ncbi:hypothetical protein D3C86_2041540 [compost metagenome]